MIAVVIAIVSEIEIVKGTKRIVRKIEIVNVTEIGIETVIGIGIEIKTEIENVTEIEKRIVNVIESVIGTDIVIVMAIVTETEIEKIENDEEKVGIEAMIVVRVIKGKVKIKKSQQILKRKTQTSLNPPLLR